MATKTEKYELRKKEENDFYNIEDFNDNMDKLETALTEFDDSGSTDGITNFTEMLTKFVTGNKLAVTLRNLKAGLQFVLHTGSIVNNCVTDNPKLPLSAAQGKELMDYFNQLNSDKASIQVASYGEQFPESVEIGKSGVYLIYACGIAEIDGAYIQLYKNETQIQGCQGQQNRSILALIVTNCASGDSIGFKWYSVTGSPGFRKTYGIVKL